MMAIRSLSKLNRANKYVGSSKSEIATASAVALPRFREPQQTVCCESYLGLSRHERDLAIGSS